MCDLNALRCCIADRACGTGLLFDGTRGSLRLSKSYDVFMSYGQPHRQLAQTVAEALRAAGYSVWFDSLEIRPGDRWARKILQGLSDSRVCLLLVGEDSNSSRLSADREALVATSLTDRRPILPVLVGTAHIPSELRDRQSVRVLEGSSNDGQEIESVVQAVGQILSRQQSSNSLDLNFPRATIEELAEECAASLTRAEQSLAQAESEGNSRQTGVALYSLGRLAQDDEDLDIAEGRFRAALSTFEELGDRRAVAATLHQLGIIAQDRGDYGRADSLYRAALSTFEELGDRRAVAATLHQLGIIAQDRGDYGHASDLLTRAMQVRQEMGDRLGVASALSQLGALRTVEGFPAIGVVLNTASHKIRRELGSPDYVIDLQWLGRQRELLGDADFSRRFSETSRTGLGKTSLAAKAESDGRHE